MNKNKVAVVTGSNKGIGYAVVKGLCQQFDGDVFLTSRNVAGGTEAVKSLIKAGFNPKYHQLDITDEQSVITLKNFLKNEYGGIDILVNNAAVGSLVTESKLTEEEIKTVLHVNYFALRNVCNILFPLLRTHARVVNVSSAAGHLSRIPNPKLRNRFSDPNLTEEQLNDLILSFISSALKGTHENDGWPSSGIVATYPYIVSKVAMSALTIIQQRKYLYDDPCNDIVVNAVNPGYVSTDMTKRKGILTPDQGAEAVTYAALLPNNTTQPKGSFIWWDKQLIDWVNGTPPHSF